MAKQIGLSDYYIDVTPWDTCPNCGEKLISVPIYGGKLVDFQRYKQQGLLVDNVNTIKTYSNFVPLCGGYCTACAKKQYDSTHTSIEGFRTARKWFLIFLITAVVSFLGALLCSRLEAETLGTIILIPFAISATGFIPATIIFIQKLIWRKTNASFNVPNNTKLAEDLIQFINISDYNKNLVRQVTGMDVFYTPDAVSKM